MIKFVVMMVLSLVITQILHLLFSEETAGLNKREEKIFKVILKQGVIGCISQEKFDKVQNFYAQNNQKEIKKILDNKDCFIFSQGEEFNGLDNYCNKDSKLTDSYVFGSKKFMLTKIILPCFAFKNNQ